MPRSASIAVSSLHSDGVLIGLVIMAHQVKNSVQGKVREMMRLRLALRHGLAMQGLRRKDDVAKICACLRHLAGGKGQHVGRPIHPRNLALRSCTNRIIRKGHRRCPARIGNMCTKGCGQCR
jgi:hypothetical protein